MEEVAKKAPGKRASRKPAVPAPAPFVETVAEHAAAGFAALAAAEEQAIAHAEAIVEAAPVPDPVAFVSADPIELIEAATSPATSSDTIPAEAIAPITKGLEDMATIAPTETVGIASEKLQSMFGDVGARFKASFEKSSKLGEEFVELTKGNVEAVVASARVAAKGSEALGQDVAEYGKKSLESAVAAMKSFASVKSPTELFQLQSDFAKNSFDSMVAEASKFSESMMKLAGDVAQPLSTRYAVAAEKIKAVAL